MGTDGHRFLCFKSEISWLRRYPRGVSIQQLVRLMCVISQQMVSLFLFSQWVRDRDTALIPRPPATRGGYANRLTPPFEHVGRTSSCIDTPRRYLRSQLIPNWKHKIWALLPSWGFSCPNLLLVFLNLLFLGTCIIFLSQVLGLPPGLFYFIVVFIFLYLILG